MHCFKSIMRFILSTQFNICWKQSSLSYSSSLFLSLSLSLYFYIYLFINWVACVLCIGKINLILVWLRYTNSHHICEKDRQLYKNIDCPIRVIVVTIAVLSFVHDPLTTTHISISSLFMQFLSESFRFLWLYEVKCFIF